MFAKRDSGSPRVRLVIAFACLIFVLLIGFSKSSPAGQSSTQTASVSRQPATDNPQPSAQAPGQSSANPIPNKAKVGYSVKNDVSPPLRDIQPKPPTKGKEGPDERQRPVPKKG